MNNANTAHKYISTETTTYACEYHIIWCTKYRRSVLSPEIQERLKVLIFEQQEAYQYVVREVDSMPDHIHLLVSIPPNISVTSVIGKIKGYTAKVLRNEFPTLTRRLPCLWTRSKFVGSVGSVTLEALKQYIENQKGV
ncbi:IS200/IS605 family transposase [Candidatus Poribacteria bacterium]|nr:IS200/IS605 family transposase [Candidatus Poribacteria bacterium]